MDGLIHTCCDFIWENEWMFDDKLGQNEILAIGVKQRFTGQVIEYWCSAYWMVSELILILIRWYMDISTGGTECTCQNQNDLLSG